jgi:hypothetical protein
MWTTENTQGYTETELDAINAEWEVIVEREGLEEGTDEYYQRQKLFSDDVASRTSDAG